VTGYKERVYNSQFGINNIKFSSCRKIEETEATAVIVAIVVATRKRRKITHKSMWVDFQEGFMIETWKTSLPILERSEVA
jgi:hypothetical protein